ncbi:aquaporin [Streptomyces sp. NPDC001787]|uniref:aquaporin n=1 Tax=Streptomyces sp. NPDC001787 TaxID=3154523 RepID=UPI0033209C62
MGLATAVIIATLGPVRGGSANPARQFGPALLAQHPTHPWIHLLNPELGAVLGAALVAPARLRTAPRPRR